MHFAQRVSQSAIVLVVLIASGVAVWAQVVPFTYQGQLKQGGAPTNGNCDFQFALFDALTDGNPVPPGSSPLSINNVPVSNGLFTVRLGFDVSTFNGADRYLEIDVRCPA